MNFITVFAAIGHVFVMYVFWYIMNKLQKSSENTTTNEISTNYMQEIGLRCPDYYVNTLNKNNMGTCKNSYNLVQNIDSEDGDVKIPHPNVKMLNVIMIPKKTVNFQVLKLKNLNDQR